ncbi:MAG: hypothetical protein ABFS12_04020 [Bacteroidota bacterium]
MTSENMNKNRPSRILRGVALTLMSITVLLTIIGAVGTVCIAIGAENYDGMEALVPYKWLYQIFVLIKFTVGFWGLYVIFTLFKGREKAYRNALIVLSIGLFVAIAQMTTSHILRGKTMPVDMRFYVTLITLIVFLIIRIPSIWPKVDFTWSRKGGSKKTIAGSAMLLSGIITITTPIWAVSSHITPEGYNLVNELAVPLLYGGLSLVIFGVATLFYGSEIFRYRRVIHEEILKTID